MKKLLIVLVAGAFLSTTAMSCSKKCGRCNSNGSLGNRVCATDNQIVYDAAVSSCVTGGGTWTTD